MQWIDVNESLPLINEKTRDSENVLVVDEDGKVGNAFVMRRCNGDIEWYHEDHPCRSDPPWIDPPTHWMPFPKPPKEVYATAEMD